MPGNTLVQIEARTKLTARKPSRTARILRTVGEVISKKETKEK